MVGEYAIWAEVQHDSQVVREKRVCDISFEQGVLGAMTDGEVAWIINLRHGVFDALRRIGVTDERLIALLEENGLWPQ